MKPCLGQTVGLIFIGLGDKFFGISKSCGTDVAAAPLSKTTIFCTLKAQKKPS
ncbi:MAG: hypothetical protein M0P13_03315 [Fibrobacteraceae bacterium]|nr:hypothetical protein [Fibrobacteraceae bacterium]